MATRGFSALVLLPRPGDDGGDGATQNRYSPQCMGSEEVKAAGDVVVSANGHPNDHCSAFNPPPPFPFSTPTPIIPFG